MTGKSISLKLNQDFMIHFRWITPLLLLMMNIIMALLLFIGKGFMNDFNCLRTSVVNLNIHVAKIEGYLDQKRGFN